MMKLSTNGIALLKKLENKVTRKGRHVVYKDQAGHPTIGYGHLIKPGEHYEKIGIDERWATDLLRADVKRFEVAVNDAVTVPLNQNEFDALVIFVFNIGRRAFRQSTALKLLNAGDRKEVGRSMTLWHKVHIDGKLVDSNGLINRRAQEVGLFYTPVGDKPAESGPPSKPKVAKPKKAGCVIRLKSWLKGD